MKKILIKTPLFLVMLTSFLFSCRLLENEPSPVPETSYFLKSLQYKLYLSGVSNKSWVIYRTFINGKEITEYVAPCDLDNILTFYNGGDYLQVDGPLKCDITRPDIYDCGSWSLNNEASKLKINGKKFHEEVDILELNNNLLYVKFLSDSVGLVHFYVKPVQYKATKFICTN